MAEEELWLAGEAGPRIKSFQTTLTPNPEKLYKFCSETKQEDTAV